MKRNLFLLPFFITSYFFSSAFLFKPNIKVITCNGIDKVESDLEILKDYPWIFDSNSGQIYSYDHIKNTLKPIKSEIYDGAETIYLENYVKEGKLYIRQTVRYLDSNVKIEGKGYLDFKNLKISWSQDSPEGYEEWESVCKEIKLPKGLQILK